MYPSWQLLWRKILTGAVSPAPRRPIRKPTARPGLEILEDRLVPSTITVTNTNDSGAGSLRQAILTSNANPGSGGPDVINFNLPSNSSVKIEPHTSLPTITSSVGINGSANGSSVILLGTSHTAENGLTIKASGCTVQNLQIGGWLGDGILITGNNNLIEATSIGMFGGPEANGTGIVITGNSNTIGGAVAADANTIALNINSGIVIDNGQENQIEGNFIGTEPAQSQGNFVAGESEGNGLDGVKIEGDAAENNTIGGTSAADANVISGNVDFGVAIITGASANTVAGNYIGANLGGTAVAADLGNGSDGVYIGSGAHGNFIGTTAVGGEGHTVGIGNVISGNGGYGVVITGAGTELNALISNRIGTSGTGTAALPNASGGVLIEDGATDNLLGTAQNVSPNLISGNSGSGVTLYNTGTTGNLVVNNEIGTNLAGSAALANHGYGVFVEAGASGNNIGIPGAGNLISGDPHFGGVYLINTGTKNNTVQANLIGVDATGTVKLGNYTGVAIAKGASDNTIGGTTAGDGNVISGNVQQGVVINSVGTTGNLVEGNQIGTNQAGTAAIGNGFAGVEIEGGATKNTIGGTTAGAGNLISGNTQQGVLITGAGTTGNLVEDNQIGTNQAGTAAIANGDSGVALNGGARDNAVAGNTLSGNGGDGVDINGAGTNDNVVTSNMIGTDSLGNAALANVHYGVVIGGGAKDNTVGDGNVISGNTLDGVLLTSAGTTGNKVESNLIGLNAAGAAAIPNGTNGVTIDSGASANTVVNNFISGNTDDGIHLSGATTEDNGIHENWIGLEMDQATPLPNATGIRIDAGANDNVIGGPNNANTIADNTGAGIAVVGNTSVGNTISQNSIFGNGGLGIDLGATGTPTTNASGGFHTGPNDLLNYPVLTASTTVGIVNVSLNSTPLTNFTIEFFSSATTAPGQGQNYLGSVSVKTDKFGNASFVYPFTPTAAAPYLTATATDSTIENTSEFSAPLELISITNSSPTAEGNFDLNTLIAALTADNMPFTLTVTDIPAGKSPGMYQIKVMMTEPTGASVTVYDPYLLLPGV